MLDVEDLRTFIEVVDAGGLTPASHRLGLSKSIVSRRLARLESELGAQLLVRTTRGIGLTEAGATFREHAGRVVAEIDAAREAISPEGDVRGRLRISVPLSFGATRLAPVLAELASRHPKLHVHAAYTDRFVDLVSEGFDAAVRLGYLPDSSLVDRRIAPIRGKLLASPAYIAARGAPRSPDDLIHHEALMQGPREWRLLHGDEVISFHPQGRFLADNGQALVAAALAGLGIAMLPDFLTDPHVATGALVPVVADYAVPEAGLFVVRPAGDCVPRKVRVLTDILIETFSSAASRVNVADSALTISKASANLLTPRHQG
jgi:DNA-binding transcriptional LysR family regulator